MYRTEVVERNGTFEVCEVRPGDQRCTLAGAFVTRELAEQHRLLAGLDRGLEVHLTVSLQDVSSLLCSALEGGSNYWYTIAEFVPPTGKLFKSMPGRVFKHLDYPLSEGGALIIRSLLEPERLPARLDLAACARALSTMGELYPHHLADVLKEQADATTGDVFLQLALYGDIIYS